MSLDETSDEQEGRGDESIGIVQPWKPRRLLPCRIPRGIETVRPNHPQHGQPAPRIQPGEAGCGGGIEMLGKGGHGGISLLSVPLRASFISSVLPQMRETGGLISAEFL
jgi:hypothetical protein